MVRNCDACGKRIKKGKQRKITVDDITGVDSWYVCSKRCEKEIMEREDKQLSDVITQIDKLKWYQKMFIWLRLRKLTDYIDDM